MSQLTNQVRYIQWFTRLVMAFMLTSVGVLVYWTFEPDPLQVTYIDTEMKWSKCNNREYSFKRYVRSEKDLVITVQERWYDLDGMMDYKGTEGEYVYSTRATYTLGSDFNKVMTFHKEVPKDITTGRYEYRPWATYQINPIKTITRLLPVQNVNVMCNTNEVK